MRARGNNFQQEERRQSAARTAGPVSPATNISTGKKSTNQISLSETDSVGAQDEGTAINAAAGSSVVVEQTDQGAVDQSFDFARDALRDVREASADAFGVARDAQTAVQEGSSEALATVSRFAQDALKTASTGPDEAALADTQNTVRIVTIAAVAVIGLLFFTQRGR